MSSAHAIAEAAAFVRQHCPRRPRAGLILGTGLGHVARAIHADCRLPYDEIPHFSCATALSHAGRLVVGVLADVPVVAMEGRCHLYEGYDANDVSFPVRVMGALGIQLLLVSNAAGGLNPRFAPGDIMLLEDHLNFMGNRVPCPANSQGAATGIPVRDTPYDQRLIERALRIAREHDFPAHRGVYVGVTGPNYETRAEYRFMRRAGGDVVGMSTIPEAIAAAQLGMRVLAMSVVTNVARPDAPRRPDVPGPKVTAQEVVDVAEQAAPRLQAILMGILAAERQVSDVRRARCEV